MSCMSQNFRLFHVSNLSVPNIRIVLLMYPGSQCLARRTPRAQPRMEPEPSSPSRSQTPLFYCSLDLQEPRRRRPGPGLCLSLGSSCSGRGRRLPLAPSPPACQLAERTAPLTGAHDTRNGRFYVACSLHVGWMCVWDAHRSARTRRQRRCWHGKWWSEQRATAGSARSSLDVLLHSIALGSIVLDWLGCAQFKSAPVCIIHWWVLWNSSAVIRLWLVNVWLDQDRLGLYLQFATLMSVECVWWNIHQFGCIILCSWEHAQRLAYSCLVPCYWWLLSLSCICLRSHHFAQHYWLFMLCWTMWHAKHLAKKRLRATSPFLVPTRFSTSIPHMWKMLQLQYPGQCRVKARFTPPQNRIGLATKGQHSSKFW